MASFVSGGGGGSKYEDIIQSAVESNGLGHILSDLQPIIQPNYQIIGIGSGGADISSAITQTLTDRDAYFVEHNGRAEICFGSANYGADIGIALHNSYGEECGGIVYDSNSSNTYVYYDEDPVILSIYYISPNAISQLDPAYLKNSIYVATYGRSSYFDIVSAYQSGKTVIVKDSDELNYKRRNDYYILNSVIESIDIHLTPKFEFVHFYEYGDTLYLSFIYLDEYGDWSQDSTQIITYNDFKYAKPWYGTCSTGANVTAKVVSCDGFILHNGVTIDVKFTYEHGVSSATLNVNSTGAKTITGATTGAWNAGDVVKFTYDGTNWNIVEGKRWNGVSLNKTAFIDDSDYYIPSLLGTSATSAGLLKVNQSVVSRSIPRRTSDGFIVSKTPTSGDDSTKVATTAFVQDAIESIDALPSQSGNSGRYLTTNGTTASWARVKELFECTYGTTTYSEITTVINYKLPYLNRNRKCYIYSGSIGDGNYETLCFDNVSNGILSRITCSDMNVWTELTAITVVPNTRTINSKALSSDITLTASDVGALPSSTTIPAQISKIYTGTCNTAASTATKTVTLDDSTGFSLTAGVRVAVTFINGNSTATPALNVNSTGVYTIAISSGQSSYKTGDGTTYNGWGAYETLIFTYTGTYWVHDPSGRLSNLSYSLANGAVQKSYSGGGGAYGSDITHSWHTDSNNESSGYFKYYAYEDTTASGHETNSFEIDATSTKIHKVVTPTADGDAANKKYVDDGLGTKQKQITVSTSEPTSSDGVNGDIWFVYEE